MGFTIQHFRNGAPVGVADRANTMYAARSNARNRQGELQSHVAIILGWTDHGDEKEVEVINFTN